MFLDDAQLEQLQIRFRKVGCVDWEGHQLVFRVPTRDEIRTYRRNGDDPIAKTDRDDQLAQILIIAYDGDVVSSPLDPAVRTRFTNEFLVECPMAIDAPRFQQVLAVLTGSVEAARATLLGKGCAILTSAPKASPTASPNGSVASPPSTLTPPASS